MSVALYIYRFITLLSPAGNTITASSLQYVKDYSCCPRVNKELWTLPHLWELSHDELQWISISHTGFPSGTYLYSNWTSDSRTGHYYFVNPPFYLTGRPATAGALGASTWGVYWCVEILSSFFTWGFLFSSYVTYTRIHSLCLTTRPSFHLAALVYTNLTFGGSYLPRHINDLSLRGAWRSTRGSRVEAGLFGIGIMAGKRSHFISNDANQISSLHVLTQVETHDTQLNRTSSSHK